MFALKKKLIFAQVLKVVGPNQGIQTHSMKHYRFSSSGYLSFPDSTVKVYRWDPLGSDINGIYDIDTPPFKCSVKLPR